MGGVPSPRRAAATADLETACPPPAARRLARAALLGRGRAGLSRRRRARAPSIRERAAASRVACVTPTVWRRLVVPASLTLRQLHAVLQTAMGWEDYHLHLFDVDGVLYGDVEEIEGRPLGDEETFTVGAGRGRRWASSSTSTTSATAGTTTS